MSMRSPVLGFIENDSVLKYQCLSIKPVNTQMIKLKLNANGVVQHIGMYMIEVNFILKLL